MTVSKEAIEAAAWAIEAEIYDLNERTFRDIAEVALTAAEPYFQRTITTEEERDSLPDRTVVLSAAGTIANIVGGRVHVFGITDTCPVNLLKLPLTVLYED